MPISRNDLDAIALALWNTHSEAQPLEVPPPTLRLWMTALPGFQEAGRTADPDELRAVQCLWYEISQEAESDVSG